MADPVHNAGAPNLTTVSPAAALAIDARRLRDEKIIDWIGSRFYFWEAYSDYGIDWPSLPEHEREYYRGVAESVIVELICHAESLGLAMPTTAKNG